MTRRRYQAYRDSGVDWLGEVPSHWEVVPLRRAFAIVNGGTPTSGEEAYWDGEIAWATPVDLSATDQWLCSTQRTITLEGMRNSSARIVPVGSVLLSTRAPIGHLALAGLPVTTNQGCRSLVPIGEIEPVFTYYALVASRSLLQAAGKGSTFMELTPTELGSHRVPLPPIEEQRAIAAFLDRETAKVDALIEKKRLLIERLEEQRTALISRTVTRGLPPEAARAAGLDPSPRLKPSGVEWLGEVPEHWEVRKFRTLLRAPMSYGVLKPEPYEGEDGVRLIRILDLGKGLSDESLVRISPGQSAEYRRTVVRTGDVVLSVVGTIGECFEVPARLDGANLSRALARIQLGDEVRSAFLRHYLRSQSFLDWVDSTVRGTAQLVLNLGQLDGLQVPLPPVKEQELVGEFLNHETERVDALEGMVGAAIERLQEYRTALITAAVTGKIDVRESATVERQEIAAR